MLWKFRQNEQIEDLSKFRGFNFELKDQVSV